jgi:cysteinyl-tRNA synthetase
LASFPDYGRLSHLSSRKLETQSQNSAGEKNEADEYDRESVGDFVLWKAYKPSDGEVFWESPWGPGRPGWHIECSAMSQRYLGSTFDLHTGGIDLCFPHHENEIAQSEAASGKSPFVRCWWHISHLQVEGQKMSKSRGNLYTVDDLEARGYSPAAVRYALLSGHYRRPLNFTFDLLHASQMALVHLDRWALENTPPCPSRWGYLGEAWEALLDDLNIPKALGILFSSLDRFAPKTDPTLTREANVLFYVLGFSFEPPSPLLRDPEAPSLIRDLAEKRWRAKKEGNFSMADALRAQIEAEGWKILDCRDGYALRRDFR